MRTARRLIPSSCRQQQSKDNAVGRGRNAREQMGLGGGERRCPFTLMLHLFIPIFLDELVELLT